MKLITLNGKPRELPDDVATVRHLVELLELTGRKIAVEQNGEIIRAEAHERTTLKSGDVVEILQFVGGGAD